MPRILLLNPNTSAASTQMMVQLVQAHCPPNWCVHGVTAPHGVALITNEAELAQAALQVQACWQQASAAATVSGQPWDGVILACFADPAIDWLRQHTGVPTIGIGEAAMRAASQHQQRFGIATTTPALDAAMHAQAQHWGLGHLYTGARYTTGVPQQLLTQADALQQQLQAAVSECVVRDGAHTVVIGGGPLGQAAAALAAHTATPLIAPLHAAAQWMRSALHSPTLN